jgi:uncharacterized protein YhdP
MSDFPRSGEEQPLSAVEQLRLGIAEMSLDLHRWDRLLDLNGAIAATAGDEAGRRLLTEEAEALRLLAAQLDATGSKMRDLASAIQNLLTTADE